MPVIEESGMRFGEYDIDNIFQIEKSHQYTDKLRQNEVKCCEFILFRDDTLIFIEAKTTNPREITAESSVEKIRKYNEYISDILTKMRHSLLMYANILLDRIPNDGISPVFLEKGLSDRKIKLILVVKNAEISWLLPLSEKLNREFSSEMQIWNISRFFVLNEEQAKRKNIVC